LLVCLNEWEEFKYSKTEFEKFYSKTLNNINEIIEFAFKCVEKNKNKEIKTKKIMVSSEELFNLKNCMDDIYSNYSFLMDELETNIPERYLNKRWYNKIKNIEKSFLYNLTEIQKEYFNFRKVNLYDMLDELEFKIRNYAMKLNKTVKFNFINDDILVDVFYIGNISKIIYELVKNCVEHSFKNKSGNEITIKFDSYENNMQISIIDNGKGFDVDEIIKNSKNKNIIDDKELDNIDNIFFNLVLYGLKNKNKGLYKIKNYVQQLKGKIKFDIKNKKGTKVYIIFPIFKKIV
jgi:chemotaxis protein histidine kinase CheA